MGTKTQTPQPSHRLYSVKGEGKNARWTEIGVAFANRDGKGFSLSYDVIPLNGRIAMREITERTEGGQS